MSGKPAQLDMFAAFAKQNLAPPAPRAKALARRTDPLTSLQSAEQAAAELNKNQGIVLTVLQEHLAASSGSFTARELAELCRSIHGGEVETYRKRVRELVALGKMQEFGARTCAITGQKATAFIEADEVETTGAAAPSADAE